MKWWASPSVFWLMSFMSVSHVFSLNFSSSLHLEMLPATHFAFCSWRLGAFPDPQLFNRAEWPSALFCLLKANFEEGTQCSLHTVASRWRPSSAHLLVVLMLSSKEKIKNQLQSNRKLRNSMDHLQRRKLVPVPEGRVMVDQRCLLQESCVKVLCLDWEGACIF